MVKLQLTHIKVKLNESLTNLIDMSDYDNKPESEKQKACLSRSYGAYSLMSLASADAEVATQAIVDGYGDNGIDAIYYDENEKNLWLVQSKWIESGNGEPETGEVYKFINGIQDLIEFKFDKFNNKTKHKQPQIEKALKDYNVKIKIILAYSGSRLGNINQRAILDFIDEQNEVSELFIFETFSLTEAHRALSGSLYNPIVTDISLINWGQNEEPYKTIYGQISAEALAQLWSLNGGRLFANNIRSFVGLNDVNDGIQDTLLTEPQSFLYLNNGVTVLCNKIQKVAMYGSDRSIGTFHCEGLSIVNGAQTVGTIGTTYDKNPEEVKQAKVFIRLISLENCPPEFALRVTKATNTQNKVENRDFISLDSQQHRLKTEFALDGITYHYKRDDQSSPLDDKNCNLEEATIVLACSSPEIRYTLIAKDKIGKLWEDANKPPYTELFNDRVTTSQIWRKIKIMRIVDAKLSEKRRSNIDREKATCTYGNRFILHIVFKRIGIEKLFLSETNFNNYLEIEIPQIIDEVVKNTLEAVRSEYPDKMVYQVFRNLEKYKVLEEKL
jgi:hypothetical protein